MTVDSLEDFKKTFLVLYDDVMHASDWDENVSTQYECRIYIRTLFTYIETASFQFRSFAKDNISAGNFKNDEIALLREEEYVLNRNGHVASKKKPQATLPSLLFSVRCYARIYETDFEVDTSHHSWGKMTELIRIRNRLVHPKSTNDLIVTDSDMVTALGTLEWFHKMIIQLFDVCSDRLAYLKDTRNTR